MPGDEDVVTRAEVLALVDDLEARLVKAVRTAFEDLTASMNEALATRGPELVKGPTIKQIHRAEQGNIARLEEWAPFAG